MPHATTIVVFALALRGTNAARISTAQTISTSERHRKLMERRIGKCIEPNNPEILVGNPGKWEELVWSKLDHKTEMMTDGWGNIPFATSSLPLGMKPEKVLWLMPHMMMGFVRDDAKYPEAPRNDSFANMDSACFTFQYDRDDNDDPAGCRVFEKSFSPLKRLRKCIEKHLDKDPIWTGRHNAEIIDDTIEFDGSYASWCEHATYKGSDGKPKIVLPGQPAKLCSMFDTIRRAEEMIKLVLFQPPDKPKAAKDIPSYVARKIQSTVTWPFGRDSVDEKTQHNIATECFEVQGDGVEEPYFSYQKISECLPLMFDKAEIQGLGVNDGITKFQLPGVYYPPYNLGRLATYPVLPVCARLAMATIVNFQYAKYTLGSVWTTANDLVTPWTDCVHATQTNCRKAYYCWEQALNRICGISKECCPDRSKWTHKNCKHNPVGDIVVEDPTGLVDALNNSVTRLVTFPIRFARALLPTKNMLGWQGQCPSAMKTGRWTKWEPAQPPAEHDAEQLAHEAQQHDADTLAHEAQIREG